MPVGGGESGGFAGGDGGVGGVGGKGGGDGDAGGGNGGAGGDGGGSWGIHRSVRLGPRVRLAAREARRPSVALMKSVMALPRDQPSTLRTS